MVCLLSDFFLQMVLFVTVLSIDIRRMEVISGNGKQQCSAVYLPVFNVCSGQFA